MSSDEPNVSDKIHILSTEDDRLKTIGEILSSDSSRKILQLLFNQSFTANQIAQKTEMSLQLVIHHLKKMQSVGVVKITNVGKNTKSHDMKYYTIDKVALVILPTEMSTPARKSKSLFNSFNRIHRLATLGGVSIAAWFSSQILQKPQSIPQNRDGVNPEFANEATPSAGSSITADDEIHSEIPAMSKSAENSDDFIQESESVSRDMMESVTDEEILSDSSSATVSEMPPAPSPSPSPQMESVPFSSQEPLSAPITTGEPSIDIFWSAIIVLGIIIAGLSIEIAIKSKKSKKENDIQ